MSEQENVDKIREMYAAFGRGDIAALLNDLADDVAWEEPGPHSLPVSGTFRGREGVAQFFEAVAATWEFEEFEPREFIAQGDRVVALGFYRARSRATGRTMESHWAMAFRLRDGKLTHFREYTDTATIVACLGV